MSRFILRYTGKGPKPVDDVKRMLAEGQAHVINDSARMVLVEGLEKELRAAVEKFDNWNLSVESTSCVLPDPHPGACKVEKPPKR